LGTLICHYPKLANDFANGIGNLGFVFGVAGKPTRVRPPARSA